MNKIFGLIIAFVGLSLMATSQPKFDIEGGFTYDWGKVKASPAPLKAKIKFFNKGNDTLIINEVKPGCGCTTAPLDKSRIEPNGFATLDVTLNAGSYDGDVTKSINIKTNDPEKANSTLMIKAFVWKPVSLLPRYFAFNKMFVSEETSTNVVLTNNTDKPIKITAVTIEPQTMKVNVKVGDIIESKKSLPVEAKVTPAEVGRFNATVTITTDNIEVEPIAITGFGNIVLKEGTEGTGTPTPNPNKH